ncbi:MAG: MFS transporter [Thermaerobacter sp.]|nr:MFS transporter [Thermaerobacter sp.]
MSTQADTSADAGGQDGSKLLVLSLVPFLMVLGNSMLIPVLPKLMAVLHVSLLQAGLVITVFSIPAGIVIPFAGALSDRVGRKIVMVPALAVYGLAGLGAGLSSWLVPHAYAFIIGFRILQGIGAGGTYQLAMALAGDMYHGKQRVKALGTLEASNGLGKVVSPIAGSAVALAVWFAPFFVYGLLSFPVAAAVWLVIRESPERPQAASMDQYWQGLRRVFQRKAASLLVTFLGGATVLFILFGVLSYLADILEHPYGVGEMARGLLIAVPVLFSAVASYLAGTVMQARLARWSRPVVAGGLGLIGCAMLAEGVIFNPFWAMPALVFQGIGTGAALPAINTLVTSATSTSERGVVTSLYGSVRFFGVALGPPMFALAMRVRPIIFFGAAGLAFAVALLSWWLINEQQMLPGKMVKPARRAESARPRVRGRRRQPT